MIRNALRPLIRSGRNNDFAWRYLLNFAPTLRYQRDRKIVSGEAARVLGVLNRDGVAISSAAALLGSESACDELLEAVTSLQRDLGPKLCAAREEAGSAAEDKEKTYVLNYLGSRPVLDLNSIFLRFALQKPILEIANAYLGMYSRLRYYNVWHTFATTNRPASSALASHREDLIF
jgi:hypothetical protein